MATVIYRQGSFIVEADGDVCVTRDRGRYVSTPRPSFAETVSEWLAPYEEVDRRIRQEFYLQYEAYQNV